MVPPHQQSRWRIELRAHLRCECLTRIRPRPSQAPRDLWENYAKAFNAQLFAELAKPEAEQDAILAALHIAGEHQPRLLRAPRIAGPVQVASLSLRGGCGEGAQPPLQRPRAGLTPARKSSSVPHHRPFRSDLRPSAPHQQQPPSHNTALPPFATLSSHHSSLRRGRRNLVPHGRPPPDRGVRRPRRVHGPGHPRDDRDGEAPGQRRRAPAHRRLPLQNPGARTQSTGESLRS